MKVSDFRIAMYITDCHITDLKAVLALYGSTSNGRCTANLFALLSVQDT